MKRLVFVCQTFYPDPQSTSQMFTWLLTKLANDNPDLDVTVLCGYPGRQEDVHVNIPRKETFGRIRIRRFGLNVDFKRNLWTRFLSYVSFLAGVYFRLLFVGRKSIVCGITNPPFMSIVLWLRSLLGRFRYQYVFQDVYPDALVKLGNLKSSSPINRFWMFLNRRSYHTAEKLVVLGRDMMELLHRDYGVPPEAMTRISPWSVTEPSEVVSFDSNPLADELGLKDKFVVQYSGNMGVWHDMNIFVDAADRLREEKGIHFLFIGGGQRRAEAQAKSEELGLNNMTWLEFMPIERLPESLTCCHVSLVSLRAGLAGVAVPCKLYGILAAGRAVIAQAPAESEVSLVVEEENCGRVVAPGDCDGLVAAIKELAADREETVAMGERAFAAHESKYALRWACEGFSKLWGLGESPPA